MLMANMVVVVVVVEAVMGMRITMRVRIFNGLTRKEGFRRMVEEEAK
jgi:hypothetical protein